ncbi:putative nuclear RNA binding protein, partial [Podospora fimiseda]
RIWLEKKEHSVEGHTAVCTLRFNNTIIWGPSSCHHNTTQLRDALYQVDPRFTLEIWEKPKTIQGHTYSISVMAGNRLYLDHLSTHANMIGLYQAI